MLSSAAAASPVSSIRMLPQEILQDMFAWVYQPSTGDTLAQAHAVMQELLDLSTVFPEWEQAGAKAIAAAAHACNIHKACQGKTVAATLSELDAMLPELQAPSWHALGKKARTMGLQPNTALVEHYLRQWPRQAPDGCQQYEWDQRRDIYLARFAAQVLPAAPSLMEEFMPLLIDNPAPMDRLVAALLDLLIRSSESTALPKAVENHVDRLPAYCRAHVQAALASMRYSGRHHTNLPTALSLVTQTPPGIRWRLLALLDSCYAPLANHPADGPDAQKRLLIDAIEALPRQYQVLALQSVPAKGWEAERTALLMASLPRDPADAARHLHRYLGMFDEERTLGSSRSYDLLRPVANHVIQHLGRHGACVCLRLLAIYTRLLQDEEFDGLRKELLGTMGRYAAGLPPRERLLVGLVLSASLTPHSEERILAFRQRLTELCWQPPPLVAEVMHGLWDLAHGLRSYLIMGNLGMLRTVHEGIPAPLWPDVRARVVRVIGKFSAEDKCTSERALGLRSNRR
ncbi:hypothetical protein GT347_22725 [Xylophilus rhododendri]|uniref:Uncharacterized protein n=1 Tax=Xylophilus rhododendri TaxID=2697032 RepID=A0A857JBJ9_9BURK|nr:hypothetical protein [Xylophilus rhododendri]QHJ00542.1 hypothetical protein GT347_22725 [Xylophilus rhododendri]